MKSNCLHFQLLNKNAFKASERFAITTNKLQTEDGEDEKDEEGENVFINTTICTLEKENKEI